MMNPKDLLRDYKYGAGFKHGDILKPRDGANPSTYDSIDGTVVVLEQSVLTPHQYTVIGERPNPQNPSDRFIKFTINGHDWCGHDWWRNEAAL